MPQSRQLAAIMFTDIVGYTALMGEDEQKAFNVLRKNRQLQKPIIEKYRGKWMKELGDGVLASFSTVTDAVMCACEIQGACQKIPDLKLRIGIHQGEVVFENNDVFGDGVNIASRLQALAPVGGTWISEAVYKNVTNKKEFITEFIREETLKNVSEPIKVYEIKLEEGSISAYNASPETERTIISTRRRKFFITGILLLLGAVLSYYLFVKIKGPLKANAATALDKSVAVLPFENLSGDPQQDYFSDGIAVEILNALSQLGDLRVPGRTSSFRFRGKNIDLKEVRQKLSVSAVLEGTVRREGNRVKIDVQLVNAASGYNLWSDQYDRTLDGVFAIQEEIATAVVKKLKVILLKDEKLDIAQGLTKNNEAYDVYLKARSSWDNRKLRESEKYFLQAIDLDSSFAAAYAGLAETYIMFPQFSQGSPREFAAKAEQAAQRAIKLDRTMAASYFTLAFNSFTYNRDYQTAGRYFQQGFGLNPNYAPGHYWYASYLSNSGDTINALKQARKSIDLDPLGPIPYMNLGIVLLGMNRVREAIEPLMSSIELNENPVTAFWLGFTYLELGQIDDARKWFETASRMGNDGATGALIYFALKSGNREKAEMLFNQLIDQAKTRYINHFVLAAVAAALGKKDLANELLKKAIDNRDTFPQRLENSELTKPLMSDPRNIELLKASQPFFR